MHLHRTPRKISSVFIQIKKKLKVDAIENLFNLYGNNYKLCSFHAVQI
jgi:hypothetical protein